MRYFFQNIAYKLNKWMQGRNGQDEFSRMLLWVGIVFWLSSMISPIWFMQFPALFLFVISVFRMVSKNVSKRQRENEKYLEIFGNIKKFFKPVGDFFKKTFSGGTKQNNKNNSQKKNNKQKKEKKDDYSFSDKLKDRKEYAFFKCPHCQKTIRVHKGRGDVVVVCPNCKRTNQWHT